MLRLPRAAIVASQWVDNGPGWVAVLLSSAAEVLAIEPSFVDLDVGVIGPYPADSDVAWEVRAFFPLNGATVEDPVTGSLNASLAGWLIRSGRATAPYVAAQGTAMDRVAGSGSQDPRRHDLDRRRDDHLHPRRRRDLTSLQSRRPIPSADGLLHE